SSHDEIGRAQRNRAGSWLPARNSFGLFGVSVCCRGWWSWALAVFHAAFVAQIAASPPMAAWLSAARTRLDSPSYRADRLERNARLLAEKTRRLLGVAPQWTHAWAGASGESATARPSSTRYRTCPTVSP